MTTHIIRLVKSQSALDKDFDRAVLGITEDAKDVALKYDGALVATNVKSGVVEICLAEGTNGPSLNAFKNHMEPSFGKHCSRVFPEIDLDAFEVFTR